MIDLATLPLMKENTNILRLIVATHLSWSLPTFKGLPNNRKKTKGTDHPKTIRQKKTIHNQPNIIRGLRMSSVHVKAIGLWSTSTTTQTQSGLHMALLHLNGSRPDEKQLISLVPLRNFKALVKLGRSALTKPVEHMLARNGSTCILLFDIADCLSSDWVGGWPDCWTDGSVDRRNLWGGRWRTIWKRGTILSMPLNKQMVSTETHV